MSLKVTTMTNDYLSRLAQVLHQPGPSSPIAENEFPLLSANHQSSPVIPLADYLPSREDTHSDFNALLTETLAGFANCIPIQVERELDVAFSSVCESLEIDRAGFWYSTNPETKSFTLAHLYPSPESLPEVRRSSLSADPLIRASEPLVLRIGADSKTCFPWITAQVQRGHAVIFSSVSQLPAEALYDKRALLRLGVRSGAVIPIL